MPSTNFVVTQGGTPQQNGLTERMNRTRLENVRCMLLSFGCSIKFQGEAAKTACYLINRSPSTALEFKTPQEVWTGKPTSLKYLRVVRCAAYPHVKQDKLESRALKCIFLGYPDGVKWYKLYCTEPGKKRMHNQWRCGLYEEEMPLKAVNNNTDTQLKEKAQTEVELNGTDQNLEYNALWDSEQTNNEEITQVPIDQDYQLTRDRERRLKKAPQRFEYAYLISYALFVTYEHTSNEPTRYREAVSCGQRVSG